MSWQSDDNVKLGGREVTAFAPTLDTWYRHHRRDLPWRETTNPYFIWLSEVILQQTRVAQGLPYYLRFTSTYPTLESMARAEERDLLRLWQGLGYYSRARNLHQTAKLIAETRSGQFPGTYQELLTLKGIGTYTAAAIASFAFGERVAVLDGNVYRVLARVFGITEDITTTGAKKIFTQLANRLMAFAPDPATYNQAIMEFGAIQCTPTSPDCLLCPVQPQCVAFQRGQQRQLPVKKKKAAVRERYIVYIVLKQLVGNSFRLALAERTGRDIWQNLYEFYPLETNGPALDWTDVLPPEPLNEILLAGVLHGPPVVGQQLLSHQRISAFFYQINVPEASVAALPMGYSWYTPEAIGQLPKPVLITNYLEKQFGIAGDF